MTRHVETGSCWSLERQFNPAERGKDKSHGRSDRDLSDLGIGVRADAKGWVYSVGLGCFCYFSVF